ncbi:MAG: hypothetical protein QJR03_04000 [Sphaerobacter sp.]|nr:hypothetical protein [Sphaerobacter sp.]
MKYDASRMTLGRRWMPLGVCVLTFVALTVLMTWPLPLRAGSTVQDLGDPLYEIWTMRWLQHQLPRDPANLWHGNTAYPFRYSLLFSEPRLSTSLLAWPIQLVTGNDVLTYNLLFLASFVVLGVGMALLVAELSGSLGAGLLAGTFAAYTPYRYGHLSHLNLLGYGWIPLALWALVRFARYRRARDAALAAGFLTVQVLASDTLALMALGMVALALPFLLWAERARRTRGLLIGLALAVLVPLLAFAPVAAGRLVVSREYGFTRDLKTVRAMSATPASYVSVSPNNHRWRATLPHAYPNPLFPGAIATLGGLLGLAAGLRRRSGWAGYAALLVVGGFILSLGPEITVAGRTVTLPYRWAYEWVPGMTAMRDVARFGMVALLGVQILAGLGLAAAWAALCRRLSGRRAGVIGALLLVLLAGGALAEYRSNVGTTTVPRDEATVAVYDWLASQPRGAVFELPANGLWTDVRLMTRQIYYSTRHWQPIVAGYTSFLPDRYIGFLVSLHEGTTEAPSRLDRENVGLLQDIGVRYVVIHHWDAPAYDWRQAVQDADQLPELRRVGNIGSATVYVLEPAARAAVRFRLSVPAAGLPGATLPVVLTATNDNPNLAVTTLDRPPDAVATWVDASGEPVLRATLPVTLPVAVRPGDQRLILSVPTPAQPGRYRLRLSAGTLVAPVEQPVEVRPAPATAEEPALRLAAVQWDPRAYAPGETVEITLHWEVRGPVGGDYTTTVQALSADDRVVAQFDEMPLGLDLLTGRWQPGAAIVQPITLRLPAELPAGELQLLVAVYDGRDPALPRLPIVLPTGDVATEGRFGPLRVTPD